MLSQTAQSIFAKLTAVTIAVCYWAGCPQPDPLSPEEYTPEILQQETITFREQLQQVNSQVNQIELQVQEAIQQAAQVEQQANRGMGNRSSDVEQWRPLVAGHFRPEDVDRALCLMAHESGGNPNAKNPNSSATGLMQVMASVWAAEYGFSQADLYVPEYNLYVARKIKDIQGWTAWAPYNRGLCR